MNKFPSITVNITGQLSLEPQSLEQFFRCFQVQAPATPPPVQLETSPSSLPRLAYTVKETAEMLGLVDKSVYRLIERGLLKSSSALRHKRIPAKEIERFLKETTQE